MNASILYWLLPLNASVPLVLAVVLCIPGTRRWASRFMIIAPLPALATALLANGYHTPAVTIWLEWLLMGTRLTLDTTGQIFLLLTAIIWLCAALFATKNDAAIRHRLRFNLCFLLAMAGNIAVTIAADLASFYTSFALMSFAAYGLIVTNDNPDTVRAGRVYITLVIIGEVMLFSAFAAAIHATGSTFIEKWHSTIPPAMTVPLIILGFGIKLGAIPWHFVLPVTYRSAPYSAVVALAGSMLNAGLLGWFRFLPLGQASLPDWGVALILLGLVAAFMGVLFGILQNSPKALLGYSSVSQVGLMTTIVGLALVDHRQWKTLSAVLLIYALHHALAKSALFFAAGFNRARSKTIYYWQCFALLLPALSIAGAPLTSGALAKSSFKAAVTNAPHSWDTWLEFLLPLSSVATSMLLIRFIPTVWPKRVSSKDFSNTVVLGQFFLVVSAAIATWLVIGVKNLQPLVEAMKVSSLWTSTWPVLTGIAFVIAIAWVLRKFNKRLPQIPSGDILDPLEKVTHYLLIQLTKLAVFITYTWKGLNPRLSFDFATKPLQSAERTLRTPVSVGILYVLIFLGLLYTLNAVVNT